MKPDKGFAPVNNTRLYYERIGKGAPLVLIHGTALDTHMWDDQIAPFSSRYEIIRYDSRGFGKSDTPTDETYSHHADLNALLDFLGVPAAHILGLSSGGAIAADFALAYPASTLSLILVDVSVLGGYPWHDQLNVFFGPIFAAAGQGNIPVAKKLWSELDWFKPALRSPQLSARLTQMLDDYSFWMFTHTNPVVGLTPPANDRLQDISAPTLIMVGELDLPYYNCPIADRLHAQIPNSQKTILPNVGHLSNMEDPTRFNQLVLEFLDKHSP